MKNNLLRISIAISLLLPSIAFAAVKTLRDLISLVIDYLNVGLALLIGVAVVIFVYYIVKYFVRPDADRKEAGYYVLYSVVGFFVILSFWGLVNILSNTFNLQTQSPSWQSFRNLFPGGSGQSTPPPNIIMGNSGGNPPSHNPDF